MVKDVRNMKNACKDEFSTHNGITLVALVVTIIVLLILVGNSSNRPTCYRGSGPLTNTSTDLGFRPALYIK